MSRGEYLRFGEVWMLDSFKDIYQFARGGKWPPAPPTGLFVGVPYVSGKLDCEVRPDLLPERYITGRRFPEGGRIIRPDAGLIEIPLLTRNIIRS